jgi:hypothetical protein
LRLRVKDLFALPRLLSEGAPFSIEEALAAIATSGHGALDPVEGAVWRVERNQQSGKSGQERTQVVDFLVKYVRPDKLDGIYLPEISGQQPVWNWRP